MPQISVDAVITIAYDVTEKGAPATHEEPEIPEVHLITAIKINDRWLDLGYPSDDLFTICEDLINTNN